MTKQKLTPQHNDHEYLWYLVKGNNSIHSTMNNSQYRTSFHQQRKRVLVQVESYVLRILLVWDIFRFK
uniref:Ovule protein n=1 Tax=Romanomermis culicivorax TaxID=13658 RepID=A0A915KJW9_ROMCU